MPASSTDSLVSNAGFAVAEDFSANSLCPCCVIEYSASIDDNTGITYTFDPANPSVFTFLPDADNSANGNTYIITINAFVNRDGVTATNTAG